MIVSRRLQSIFAGTLLCFGCATSAWSADLELGETLSLPECHSLGWVRSNTQARDEKAWNGVLDEAKWGTPSPEQAVARNWSWSLTDEQWRAAVAAKGEGKREDVVFALWIPEGLATVRGLVVISGHGSGETLYRHAGLRAMARELGLGLFKFTGNPMQRGFWPRSLLDDRLRAFGKTSGHPELVNAPVFLYGHSNGTGFSAIYPASGDTRVWAWVSMRPGTTFQVYQPGAAKVPGLVIFGEDDDFLKRPSVAENLAVVPAMRKNHEALWGFAVEPKTGHGPGEKTWPLVFSFLRHSFAARVPAMADPAKGPVTLTELSTSSGYLGTNWDSAKGGYQDLATSLFGEFNGEKSSASWLINEAFAKDWRIFQREGEVK